MSGSESDKNSKLATALTVGIIGFILVVSIILVRQAQTQPGFSGSTGLFDRLKGRFGAADGTPSKAKPILLTILTVALIGFIILVIVHFTIRPIFRSGSADPGLIPIPTLGSDTTGHYWKSSSAPLASANTVLTGNQSGTMDFSLAVDVLIHNPNVKSAGNRPIFWRSDKQVPDSALNLPEGANIVREIGVFNFAAYLAPQTNDLIVSVLNGQSELESVVVQNVPTGEAFRLGIILTPLFLEVYINGKLYRTRNLASPPLPVVGSFMPPGGPYADMAAVRNLRIWRGSVPPAKMRYLPALPGRAEFGVPTDRAADSVELTPGCPAAISDSTSPSPLQSMKGAADYTKSLLGSVSIPSSITDASNSASSLLGSVSVPSSITGATDSAKSFMSGLNIQSSITNAMKGQ